MKKFFLATMWPVLPIALFIIYLVGCKKDVVPSTAKIDLTIEEAMKIFEARVGYTNHGAAVYRGDSIDAPYEGPIVTPDWGNADVYWDEPRQISVIEVPILDPHLSKIVIVPENTTLDSSFVDQSIQLNKLIFFQDSLEQIHCVIMKLNGTPGYLATHDIEENAFSGLMSNFEGRLGYYDLNDSLLSAYLIQSGYIYTATKPEYRYSGGEPQTQERWGYCIDHYEYVSCTGPAHHTWSERDKCPCGKTRFDCSPPRAYAILYECSHPLFPPTGNGGQVLCCNIPPRPNNPVNQTGTGGGSNGTNPANQFMQHVGTFNLEHNVNLLNDFEDQAHACNGIQNYEDYEDCVMTEIGESIPGIDDEPANPTVSISQPICSQILSFSNFQNEVNQRPAGAMILHNAYFSFTFPDGSNQWIEFVDIRFEIYDYGSNNAPCLSNAPVLAAQAINTAVTRVQGYLNSLSVSDMGPDILESTKGRMYFALQNAFSSTIYDCNPNFSGVVDVFNQAHSINPANVVDCDAGMGICP